MNDCKFAIRQLLKNPGFSLVAILSIAMGIGGNTGIFTIANAIFFRPLPGIQESGNLVSVFQTLKDRPDSYSKMSYPDYFALMQIPLRQGRSLTRQDEARAQPVVVVSEHTAQHFWPGENPIGKRLRLGKTESLLEVVGVVGNTKAQDIREKPQLQAYLPLAQRPQDALVFHVRAPRVENQVQSIQALLGELDSHLPAHDVETLSQHVNRSLFLHRMIASLALIFAGLALLLAAAGIYGVVDCATNQRIREIGIRMALGADRKRVLFTVLSQGARLAAMGILLGLVPAMAITKLLSGFLVNVRFLDPVSFAGVSLLLLGVALVATLAPALRAMRIEPMEALRYE